MERSNQFSVTNCICKGGKKNPSAESASEIYLLCMLAVNRFCSLASNLGISSALMHIDVDLFIYLFMFFNVFFKGSVVFSPMQIFPFFSFTILSLTEKKMARGKDSSLHLDGRLL